MAVNGGFITLHRQILDWEWYKDINTKVLFLHLLLKANYKDLNFEGRKILRGQLVTSLPSLASQTGLSVRQIRVSLDKLKLTGEVTSSVYARYRVITIVKYDEYQVDDRLDDRLMTGSMTAKGQADDRLMTGSRQADDRLVTASKQYNNINKGTKEQGNNTSASRRGASDESFEEFWSEYPRKVSKPAALKAWNKLKPDEDLIEQIMSGLEKWRNSDDWARDNGQYIPYPATWLNGRRWEDDVRSSGERKPQSAPVRQVSGQQYQQRDYSGEQEYWMNRMIEEIKKEQC